MKIHEYQAKELFKKYSIPIPAGRVVTTVEEALGQSQKMEIFPLVVKAQVHAGGRGKGGGVRSVRSVDELKQAASDLLGKKLITPQTYAEGKLIESILVEENLIIEKEIYAGITIDRSRECVIILVSPEGGMEIEKVALEMPEKIISEAIDSCIGLRGFQIKRMFYLLGLESVFFKQFSDIILNLYLLFIEKDCSLVEINPLVITKNGKMVALDGKITFDDNAFYRHHDVSKLRDNNQENYLDLEASKYNLNYIKLKGNVGCMVNGAGLAMATMDLIKHVGAEPANFLDVGGGATSSMIAEGLRILLSDNDVKVIFVNIFGGILRCDTVAKGLIDIAKKFEIVLPMIVRLEGTNVEIGRKLLEESNLIFEIATDMGDAAYRIKIAIDKLQ